VTRNRRKKLEKTAILRFLSGAIRSCKRDASGRGVQYERGFIDGLRQAKRFIHLMPNMVRDDG
jgi:hypothetical protein